MARIRFCRVNLDYIKYLWEHDKKVQYNQNEPDSYSEKRPYIGIVLNIGDCQYFAPLEHPRPSHMKIKSNPHILKINGGRHGLIAFNNMIPINDMELVFFDFKDEEPEYQKILKSQFIFCDKNKKDIYKHAEDTYNKVAVDKVAFFIDICCNFKLLEEKSKEYKTR